MEKPSQFCPDFCKFVQANDFCCRLYTECWHKQDKEVPPRVVEITISGVSRRVTIVGENEVHKPIWYLDNGEMLPKNYDIFSTPIERQEPSKKEIYDAKRKRR